MTAARHLELVSESDYLAGELIAETKHEYLGGHIHNMAGGKNTHNTIAVSLVSQLYAKLRGKPCQAFNSDTKVRVQMRTHRRYYYPDAMVVCEPNAGGDTFQDRPVVIGEVLSTSTRRIDTGEKLDAYLTIPSLAAYLIIEPTQPSVIVYRRTAEGFVVEQYDGLDSIVSLEAIDVQLSLSELYERVDFAAAAIEEAPPAR